MTITTRAIFDKSQQTKDTFSGCTRTFHSLTALRKSWTCIANLSTPKLHFQALVVKPRTNDYKSLDSTTSQTASSSIYVRPEETGFDCRQVERPRFKAKQGIKTLQTERKMPYNNIMQTRSGSIRRKLIVSGLLYGPRASFEEVRGHDVFTCTYVFHVLPRRSLGTCDVNICRYTAAQVVALLSRTAHIGRV